MRRAKHRDERIRFNVASKNVARPSKGNKRNRGEIQMPRLKVGVQFYIDPTLLEAINDNVKANSQSEKLRLCVTEGYKRLKR
jgi:hypothetical protein